MRSSYAVRGTGVLTLGVFTALVPFNGNTFSFSLLSLPSPAMLRVVQVKTDPSQGVSVTSRTGFHGESFLIRACSLLLEVTSINTQQIRFSCKQYLL